MKINAIAKAIVTQTADAMHTARGMIEEAEMQARAEMRAALFTNCPACQSGLVPFLKDTPHADHEAINEVVKTLWETCPDCIAEYQEWADAITCEHGKHGFDDCNDCMDAWADANAPEDVMLDTPSEWEVQHGI